MQLHIHRTVRTDVVHYYDSASGECIHSIGHRFTASVGGQARGGGGSLEQRVGAALAAVDSGR